MGFEALAEQAEAGFGSGIEGCDPRESIQFWQDRLNDLKIFMERWSSIVNLDQLDFLANPGPFQVEAEKRESKNVEKKPFVRRNAS